jgi:hypothetical protein
VRVEAATRTPDGRWSVPRQLSPPGKEAGASQIVLDEAGNAAVMWSSGDSPYRQAWMSTRPAAGDWSTRSEPLPRHVVWTPTSRGSLAEDDLAVDGAGDAAFLFVREDGLHEAFNAAGQGWTTALVRPLIDPIGAPDLALASGGDAVIVGLQQAAGLPAGPVTIVALSRPAGGAWSAPQPIDWFPFDVEILLPHLAVAPSGRAVLAWRAPTLVEDRYAVRASTREDGVWSPPHELGLVSGAIGIGDPQVAIDARGDAIVAWIDTNPPAAPGRGIVRAAIRPAGGGWSPPRTLSGDDGYASTSTPRVAIDEAGNAAVLWGMRHPREGIPLGFFETVQAAVFSSGAPRPAPPVPPASAPGWLSLGEATAVAPPSQVDGPPPPSPPAPASRSAAPGAPSAGAAGSLELDRLRVEGGRTGSRNLGTIRFNLSRAATVTITLRTLRGPSLRRRLVLRGRSGSNAACLCRLAPARGLPAGRYRIAAAARAGVHRSDPVAVPLRIPSRPARAQKPETSLRTSMIAHPDR